jgi:hypothetical protein
MFVEVNCPIFVLSLKEFIVFIICCILETGQQKRLIEVVFGKKSWLSEKKNSK